MANRKPKGKALRDQFEKLRAISIKNGWTHRNTGEINFLAWENALGVKAPTLSSWLKLNFVGKPNPIGLKNIERMAEFLKISEPELVESSLADFLKLLGIESLPAPAVKDRGVLDVFYHRPVLAARDRKTMEALAGRYDMVLFARNRDRKIRYLAVQRVEIGSFDEQHGACPIWQEQNNETGERASGWLRVTADRAVAILSFELEYPESTLYSVPIYDADSGQRILYGLYTDVTTEMEIFSVRFVMMPAIQYLESKKKIDLDHPICALCEPFLKDGNLLPEDEGQQRLIIPFRPQFSDMVRNAIQTISRESSAWAEKNAGPEPRADLTLSTQRGESL
jgi:hypothetical protein